MKKRLGMRTTADRERQRRFEALLRERRRIVFKVAAAYAGGVHDRDDLAQEIAVQLWRSFGRFDERRAKFSTWMYRVALNVAISQRRQTQRSGADRLEPLSHDHMAGTPARLRSQVGKPCCGEQCARGEERAG